MEKLSETVGNGGESKFSIIIGWNGKRMPINIYTTVNDRKHTQLFYEQNNKDYVLTLEYDDFHKLKKLIPEKDYEIVQEKLKANLPQNEYSDTSKTNQQKEEILQNTANSAIKEQNSSTEKINAKILQTTEDTSDINIAEKFKELKDLLSSGYISEEDYNKKKEELLRQL